MKTAPADTAAEEQAALWAARLDGSTLSAADRAALEAWLATAPHHRDLLAGYCQFSADLEQQLPLLEGIRDQVAEISAAPAPALSLPWLRRPVLAGVTLAAAAALAFFLFIPDRTQFENFVTPVAQRQSLVLADGTHVELNAHTSLQVEFDRATRHVRLASGQAFFAVTRDPARPFIVETPAGAVRVTGTAFDVRAEPALLEVTVQDGTVQVSPSSPATTAALKAGEQLTAQNSGLTTRTLSPAELNNTLAWRRGFVVFNGARLDEALARFSRYHGRSLTATSAVAGKRIGGRFSLDDLEGFFTELESIYPEVRVSRDLNGAVRVDLRESHP